MLETGTLLTIDIEKPAAGGRMIARHEGQVVLVGQAIPGERLRVRVSRVKPGVAYAEPVEVIDASPDRRDAGPDWACGGCALAHVAYARQPALKSDILRDALSRIGGVRLEGPIPVVPSPQESGYRMRARLHVRRGRIGFFREGTHELCDPAPTRQLLPATLAVLADLEAALRRWGSDGATDIDLAENLEATERVAHLTLAPGAAAPPARSFDEVAGLTGVSWSGPRVNGSRPRSRLFVRDTLSVGEGRPPFTLRHHVQSFFQANRYLLPTFVSRVLAQVPPGRLLDLYAGVGLFAAGAAARGDARVTAVEGDLHGAADLKANSAPFEAALVPVHLPVERFLHQADARGTPDTTVLIDPPRTGLSAAALKGMLALRPPRIVYVSCDVATLARDVKQMTAAGYHVGAVEGFDLFPNTAHVESVVVMVSGTPR